MKTFCLENLNGLNQSLISVNSLNIFLHTMCILCAE